MANLGDQVIYHTVNGDVVGWVIGLDPESDNTDDNVELFVVPGREQRNEQTGLSSPTVVPSHEDTQAGGYSAAGTAAPAAPAEPAAPVEDPSVPAEPVSDSGADEPA